MGAKKRVRMKAADESFEMTFIALMLLLLCFMVIMVSLAQLEGNRFRKAIGSVRGALSMLSNVSASSMIQDQGAGMLPADGSPPGAEEVLREIGQVLKGHVGDEWDDWVVLEFEEPVLRMTLGNINVFELGGARLRPDSGDILDALVEFIRLWEGEVQVVGHTCDLPIHTTDFASNWELSVARAVTVANYLDAGGVDGDRIVAVGVADSDPLVPNENEENRTRNRRIQIILDTPSPVEAPAPEPAGDVAPPGRS